jgi:hypothetical protein
LFARNDGSTFCMTRAVVTRQARCPEHPLAGWRWVFFTMSGANGWFNLHRVLADGHAAPERLLNASAHPQVMELKSLRYRPAVMFAILAVPTLIQAQESAKNCEQLNTRLKVSDKIIATDTQERERLGKIIDLSSGALNFESDDRFPESILGQASPAKGEPRADRADKSTYGNKAALQLPMATGAWVIELEVESRLGFRSQTIALAREANSGVAHLRSARPDRLILAVQYSALPIFFRSG